MLLLNPLLSEVRSQAQPSVPAGTFRAALETHNELLRPRFDSQVIRLHEPPPLPRGVAGPLR